MIDQMRHSVVPFLFWMQPLQFVMVLSQRYSIEKKEKLGTRWVKCGKTSGPDCKYRVTDVIEGTEVQFQVSAENEAGIGHPSEPTEILTIEDPTGLSSGKPMTHQIHSSE